MTTLDPVRQAHWETVYNTKEESGVSWYQQEPARSLKLIQRAGVGPDAALVDVGAGASLLVDRLLALGFSRITVVDIAASALAKSRARLGTRGEGVHWQVADVTSWKPAEPFDLWHDRAVFHFLTSPIERDHYRQVLLQALRPGGWVVMATFALDGPEKCSGLPVERYDAAKMATELGPAFQLVESVLEEHQTPSGKLQRFQFFLLQRIQEG